MVNDDDRREALAQRTLELLERIDATLNTPRAEGEWRGPPDPPPPAMVRKVHTPRVPSALATALQSTLARAFASERAATDADLDRLEARVAEIERRLAGESAAARLTVVPGDAA